MYQNVGIKLAYFSKYYLILKKNDIYIYVKKEDLLIKRYIIEYEYVKFKNTK